MLDTFSKINAADRLIVALDIPHDLKNPERLIEVADATEIIRMLNGTVSFFKIGWPLFMATGGQNLASEFIKQGKRVFLDLKFGDIAETVKRLIMSAVERGISFITINSNIEAVRAAVEARRGSNLKILAVTLLTSLDENDLRKMNYSISAHDYVIERAKQGIEAGCDGVICSGREAAAIRKNAGENFLVVTPGIRPGGFPLEDHKRSTAPGEAISAGADYLVVGRPIIRSQNPRDAAIKIINEMQQAFDARLTRKSSQQAT